MHKAGDFYPRPPRGGRLVTSRLYGCTTRFLSTPSARRATDNVPGMIVKTGISIHALREEGDRDAFSKARSGHDFYPRPPRGGRLAIFLPCAPDSRFLSTPSARRATPVKAASDCPGDISIHALREEGDELSLRYANSPSQYFYPRPPRGGRHPKPAQTV